MHWDSVCGTRFRKEGVTSLKTACGGAPGLSLWDVCKRSIGLLMMAFGGTLELTSWDARKKGIALLMTLYGGPSKLNLWDSFEKKRCHFACNGLRWCIGTEFVGRA